MQQEQQETIAYQRNQQEILKQQHDAPIRKSTDQNERNTIQEKESQTDEELLNYIEDELSVLEDATKSLKQINQTSGYYPDKKMENDMKMGEYVSICQRIIESLLIIQSRTNSSNNQEENQLDQDQNQRLDSLLNQFDQFFNVFQTA